VVLRTTDSQSILLIFCSNRAYLPRIAPVYPPLAQICIDYHTGDGMNNSNDGSSDPDGLSSLHDAFRALAILLATITVTTAGVNASAAVAIQCISGRSIGLHFFLNGSIHLTDRYNGMRGAFGGRQEVFIPGRRNGKVHYPPLGTADYDNLVTTANRKRQIPISDPSLSMRTTFPVMKWGLRVYGKLMTLAYVALVLLPMFIIAYASWTAGNSWPSYLLWVVVFTLTSAFGGTFLDVQRDVCYLRVRETDLSPALGATWVLLYDGALGDAPSSPSEAVHDVSTGRVRKHGKELLIPTVALKPSVEFRAASWLSILAPLRAPLMAAAYFSIKNSPCELEIAYFVATFFQACLQRAAIDLYLSDVATEDVIWFRRLPMEYTEELVNYRRVLG